MKNSRFNLNQGCKSLSIGLTVLVVLVVSSCASYKHSKITFQQTAQNKSITSEKDKPDLYVYQNNKVYLLKNAKVSDEAVITGEAELVRTPIVLPDSSFSKKEMKRYAKAHKNEIHVFTYPNNDVASIDENLEAALMDENNASTSFAIELTEQNVKKVYTTQKGSDS